MSKLHIELIPERAAVRSAGETELNLVIRILPAKANTEVTRPHLNLGLVLDRSGSMEGDKLREARNAAAYAVQELLDTDRASLTVFDNHVTTMVPSIAGSQKHQLLNAIKRIDSGGSTALHAAWVEGGIQVSNHLSDGVNRVLLLTDGLANAGETSPDKICDDVHQLAKRGVSTTTLGIGRDYNEDLLQAMASSGDGNYYFIEGASQLAEIFANEMQGLAATTGQKVSLGLEPRHGVQVIEVLNDFETNVNGRYKLPNLIAEQPILVTVKLKVPAAAAGHDLCFIRLAWDDPRTGERHVVREALELPGASEADYRGLTPNPLVEEQISLLTAARLRDQAAAAIDRGAKDEALQLVRKARQMAVCMAPSPAASAEIAEFDYMEQELEAEADLPMISKLAKFSSYKRKRSQ